MRYDEIKLIADELVKKFRPVCRRVEIAGSIRRLKPDCDDMDIVVIPDPAHLVEYRDLVLSFRPCRGDALGKAVVFVYRGVRVDLFTATRDTWGYILAIRTGPQELSIGLVVALKNNKYIPANGVIREAWTHKITPMPEEEDVFKLAGLPYTKPEDRN